MKKYGGTVYIPLKTFDGTLCVPMDVSGQFVSCVRTYPTERYELIKPIQRTRRTELPENYAKLVLIFPQKVKTESIKLNSGDIVYILGETDNYYRVETRMH